MTFDPARLTSRSDTPYSRCAKYTHPTDTLAAMQATGYFDAAYAALPKGTTLEMVAAMDGTPRSAEGVVTASSSSGVTIAMAETSAGAGVAGGFLASRNGISSKASDAAVARFIAPFKGKIVRMDTVLNGALATGDATVTLAIAGTPVTGGVATATQSGSAAGDVDTATPTAANTFTQGQLITATVGGSSTATATLDVQLVLEETA
ncbi:MAG: hypothetical protein AB7F78_00040 [Hyphomicrobiaceae bacterium]